MLKKFLIAVFCFSLLVLAAIAGGYYWLTTGYAHQPSLLAENKIVVIAPGTGGKAIAETLEKEQVISHPPLFRLLSLLNGLGPRFQAGEYDFAAASTPLQVMQKLVSGEVVQHQITLPEGLTTAEIISLLSHNTILDKSTLAPSPAEGSLLPETYHFTRGTTQSDILKRMQQAQVQAIQKLWPERDAGLPYTTPQEAVIMASIIEKETGVAAERTHVAAVYINRLKIGMPLQADPTVSYALHGGQTDAPPLTLADLKQAHPYNTYMNKGLPPGPICNPGKDSLYAALHPVSVKDLYFVATGEGGHYFAETLTGHQENVKRYRAIQKQERKAKKVEKQDP